MIPILFVFFLIGCATINVHPEESYFKALRTFVTLSETYQTEYELQTPEVQADWKARIDPIILRIDKVLDVWGTTMSEEAEIEYSALYLEFIKALREIGLVEVIEND